jgi:hypothetical protein
MTATPSKMTSMSSMHHPRLSDLGAMAADRIPLERANEGSEAYGFFLALREGRRVFHRGRSVRGRGSAGRRLMIPMPRRANPSARTTRKRSRAASRPVRSRFTFVADIIFFRFILFVQGGLKNLGVGRRRLAFARQPPRSARVALHPLRARHHPLRLSPRLLTCSLPPRSGTRTSPWLSRWG